MNIIPAVVAANPQNSRRSAFSNASDVLLVRQPYLLLVLGQSDQLFQIGLCSTYVFYLLWPRNFSFDRNRTAVIQLFQARNDTGEIDLALANRDFLAEFSGVGRPEAIFRVNSLDMWGQDFDRVDWICLAVQNQIREIKIHTLVIGPDVLDRADERDRSFLPRLVKKVLTVRAAIRCNFTNRFYCFDV